MYAYARGARGCPRVRSLRGGFLGGGGWGGAATFIWWRADFLIKIMLLALSSQCAGVALDASLLQGSSAARAAYSVALSDHIHTFTNRTNRYELERTHRRFDLLGPTGPRCRQMERYGHGDEEKRACGLRAMPPPCTIISMCVRLRPNSRIKACAGPHT